MKIPFILFSVLGFAVTSGIAVGVPLPGIWIDVPYIAQTTDGCGSASISMVMQYWGGKTGLNHQLSADPERIQRALFIAKEGGIPASAMQKYFAGSGYRAFAFHGSWQDLRYHLERGRPLIVSLRASPHSGSLHYVVVVGIDPDRKDVFVNDPAQQKMLRISQQGFESEWIPTHNWTLLAVPRSED